MRSKFNCTIAIASVFFLYTLSGLSLPAQGAPLRLVFHDFAPFSYQNQQQQNYGLLVEVAMRVCQELPQQCEIEIKPNRRAKQMLTTGKANGIFLAWNPERAKTMMFSIPMVETEYGFYSVKSFKIKSIYQLSGQDVGVYGPSNTETSLLKQQQKLLDKGLKPFQIEVSPQGDEFPLRMLAKQRFIAYYSNKDVGAYYAQQMNLKDLNYFRAEGHIYYCIAFDMAYNKREVVIEFNRILQNLLEQKKLDHIYEKWNMTPAYLDPVMYEDMNMPY
ncbi:substrate-binding periplasmic protein [Shewanella sp. 1180_01]|uniref:substrate-binding periplasmic protein n=1 Tax=Shewanella sp. 1180_01 TaxID=2604451 RepID=UPI0040640980